MNIPIKRGMLIRHHDHLFMIADIQEHHSGKQRPTIHVSLRDALDGHQMDRTLDQLEPIVEVEHGYRQMQYLYAQCRKWVFMDSESFEEFELSPTELQGYEPFLKEGETYRVLCADGRPLQVELPEIIPLRVAQTAPPGHSVGVASNIQKEAALENGLSVNVPLFIKIGDLIRVDTRTKTYVGKEQAAD
jgi:elongation factor P